MSPFWSGWIMFLVVLNLGITLFLFVWAQRVKIPTQPDGTSGHVWAHGVLRESVRRLPLWWVILSAAMFVVGLGYLYLYPGFGAYQGKLGWTSREQLARDVAANDAKLDPVLQRFAGQPVEAIARDATATRMGERLFIDNCAACHGRAGHGNPRLGAPNLVDSDWLYGGDGAAILASIEDGRHGTMPPFSGSFDQDMIENIANYVLSLSGSDHSPAKAKLGAPQFTLCAVCHGRTGDGDGPVVKRGFPAPPSYHIARLAAAPPGYIVDVITHGHGVMYSYADRVAPADRWAIAAYVKVLQRARQDQEARR